MLNHRPLARSLLWGGYDGDGNKVVEVVSSSAMPVFFLSSSALVVVSFILFVVIFPLARTHCTQDLVNRWGMEGDLSSSSSSSSMTTCVEKERKKG